MKRTVPFIIALLPVVAAAKIELSLSGHECRPGDVIELHAESIEEQMVSFELKLPQHEALHLVAHQRQPMRYSDGAFRQKDVWVLQAMQAGTIELKDIKARVFRGEISSEVALPPQTIEVLSYAAPEDDLTAEALPEASADKPMAPSAWLFLAITPLLLLAYLFSRARATRDGSSPPPLASLESLEAALKAGERPTELTERLLTDPSLSLSQELRAAMERAVYRQGSGWDELRSLLGKGVTG